MALGILKKLEIFLAVKVSPSPLSLPSTRPFPFRASSPLQPLVYFLRIHSTSRTLWMGSMPTFSLSWSPVLRDSHFRWAGRNVRTGYHDSSVTALYTFISFTFGTPIAQIGGEEWYGGTHRLYCRDWPWTWTARSFNKDHVFHAVRNTWQAGMFGDGEWTVAATIGYSRCD